MELAAVFERLVGAELAVADRAAVVAVLGDVSRLRGWLDSRELACLERLGSLTEVTFPDVVVADATGQGHASVARLSRRAQTLSLFARFAKALEAGELTSGHVDALTYGLRDLPAAKREMLAAHEDVLLDAARAKGVDEFVKVVRGKVAGLLSDEDRSERLARQRRAVRLRLRVNTTTQMVRLSGELDPETGARVVSVLEADMAQRFGDRTNLPDTTPDDPREREDHLRALSLTALLLEPGSGSTPETLMVVDEPTLQHGSHRRSIVDVGIDVELPHESLQRIAHCSKIVPVVMRDGVVVAVFDGHNQLNLGRASRLAGRSQRRALRATYPTCAIAGCGVRFSNCRIHHIDWWEHGGGTDLHNLVPLCSRHHHAVHDHGWTLSIEVERNLTVTQPDGTTMTTGPPYAFAA